VVRGCPLLTVFLALCAMRFAFSLWLLFAISKNKISQLAWSDSVRRFPIDPIMV